MATYAVSITFMVGAKTHEKAEELANRIGSYVQQEDMAGEYSIIDIELLDEEETLDSLDFEDDDE